MDPCHTPGPGDEPPAADVVGLQRARRTRTTGGRNGPRPDSDDDIRGTPRAYERRCAPELRTTSAIVGGLLALTMLVLSTVVLVRGLMMGGPAGLMLICGFVPTSIAVVLPVLLLVAAPLRWRLRADAAGIHSRGALRTAHIPWPVSRAEIAVIPSWSVRGQAVAQYRPAAGGPAVTLFALTRPATTLVGSPTVVDEIEALWRWAAARGYVPVVPRAVIVERSETIGRTSHRLGRVPPAPSQPRTSAAPARPGSTIQVRRRRPSCAGRGPWSTASARRTDAAGRPPGGG